MKYFNKMSAIALALIGQAAVAYARAGGAPGLTPALVAQLASERPDLLLVGEYASTYGFVLRGGTSANALGIYDLQAKEFTGFWAGTQDLDTTMANTAAGMTTVLAP